MYLKSKYPQKLFDLDGVGKQLDLAQFSRKFFSSNTTADASIDANANVDDISVISYSQELKKPFERINSYYMLWKELKRLYGLQIANETIEMQLIGDIYIHDFHGLGAGLPYCFNYSTYDIMLQGLSTVKKIKSFPPKYLYSFKSQLEQFVVIASNSTLGATGLADLLIVMSLYADQILKTKSDAHFKFVSEQDCWDYIKENLVSFIYTINQPMRANQSPFTNVSVFDSYFLDNMINDYENPHTGKHPQKETIQKLQELFLDIMNEELNRTPITFPITTACFSIDDNNRLQDKDFLAMISQKNCKYGFINIYIGKSSTLSSCCFSGEQKVLTRSSEGIKLTPIQEVINGTWDEYKKNFTVFHNGSWAKAKTVKLPYNRKMYKITTANNKQIIVTDNHLHLTINGNKPTIELSTDDYLAFNSRDLSSIPEKNDNLTYEQGFLIGLYVGDGSKYKRKDSNCYEVTFSLNETNLVDIKYIKKALVDWNIKEKIHINNEDYNVMFVKIYSEKLFNIISKYVYGNYAYEKELNLDILEQKSCFRKGIVNGWYASDGGNSNRIYTTSTKLVEHGETLFSSLGMNTIINVSDKTGEGKVIIRGQSFNRNYPLYCIRWYDMKNKRSMDGVYRIINNTEYFKITSIEEVEYSNNYVYCFEMSREDEPYFTLPNGVVSHNCRLRSEKNNEYFNSFGSGSSKIGSLGVVSINLPRLAIKYKNNVEEFKNKLSYMVTVCAKINNAKRHIVKRRIENGNHPLYKLGFIDINSQYSTVGVNGFNEMLEILGYDILTEEGSNFGVEVIELINKINDKNQAQYKSPHNAEQVPGENMSIKVVDKDKLLGFQTKYEMYSNQFIPLTTKADLLDRILLQGKFDKHFSGGSICHLNIEEQIADPRLIEDLILSCAEKGVIYFAINYNIQRCENEHMTVGKKDICPICGKLITDNFTRVVGFLTNTKNWHEKRRTNDYPNRQWY